MGLPTSENASALQSAAAIQAASSTKAEPPAQSPPSSPDKPLVTIERSRSWGATDLRDLWAHRELLYFLTWRDIKVRYKQTMLGVAWIVMQPLLMTLIFTIFLGKLARVPFEGPAYPIFLFVGLMPWNFFSSAINTSGNSLVGNANLITKVYFPRAIVPAAAVGARLVDLAITCMILAGLMFYYHVPLTLNVLMLPVLVLLTTLLALGCGMLFSATNVKYRDVGVALPVVTQLWMFVSPVLYPGALVPAKWRTLYSLNPLVGIINGFRASLLGGTFDWPALLISAVITVVLLVFSAYLFRWVERGFADII
jgi:lipopolysaccharide transport system permease protein